MPKSLSDEERSAIEALAQASSRSADATAGPAEGAAADAGGGS